MRHGVSIHPFLSVPLLMLVLAVPVFADFVNGDFETGDLSGWTVGYLGDAGQIVDTTSMNSDSAVAAVGSGTYAASGTYGAYFGNSEATWNTDGSLNYGADHDGSPTLAAWGICQQISVAAGDTISYDYRAIYNLSTITADNESSRTGPPVGFVALLLGDASSGWLTMASLGTTGTYSLNSPTGTAPYTAPSADFTDASGNACAWVPFSYTFTADDIAALGGPSIEIGFIAANGAEAGAPPFYVNLDKVALTHDEAGTGSTPELGSFALMGLSMLPVVGAAIRRRKAA